MVLLDVKKVMKDDSLGLRRPLGDGDRLTISWSWIELLYIRVYYLRFRRHCGWEAGSDRDGT